MKITRYNIETSKEGINLKIACISDLHARPHGKVISALRNVTPDLILLAGDIFEIAAPYMDKRNQSALEFVRECVRIAPTYYTKGNHEIFFSHARMGHQKTPDTKLEAEYSEKIRNCGVKVINDDFSSFTLPHNNTEILIGGAVCGRDKDPSINDPDFDVAFINRFEDAGDSFKILLCHYPHYYPKYLKEKNFDLILSGHAHGGQWRIFGKGIFAPHQGLFPRLTSGIHNGKLIISRGAANNIKPIPRIFNPCEILEINIKSER